ncbi:MAG: PepSY-associated TM helix domain-containing protein [Comamonas sp.]
MPVPPPPLPPSHARAHVPAPSPLLAFVTRLHFYIGLFVGPFIFVAALTGTLYVLTPQIEARLYAHLLTTAPASAAQPLAAQIDAARAYAGPGPRLWAVRPATAEGLTTRVMFTTPDLGESESLAVFVDPATLAVRGASVMYGTSGILPLRTTLDHLHRSLLLGSAGRHYSELAASWLWLAMLGGLMLWLARRRHEAAALTPTTPTPQTTPSARRLHRGIGMAVAVGLLFLSATGLTWSRWAGGHIDGLRNHLGWTTPSVSTQLATPDDPHHGHAGHGDHEGHDGHAMPPAPYRPAASADPAAIDAVLAAARAGGIDSPAVEIRPPRSADQAWTVREYDRSWPSQVDTVAVDPATMTVVSAAYFEDFPLIAKLIRWGIDLHMGVLFGWASQLLMAALGTATCALVALGYLMWWRRRPAPGAQAPTQTLAQAWLALPRGLRALALLAGAALGYALPVLGASLLAFVLIDIARHRRAAQRGLAPSVAS